MKPARAIDRILEPWLRVLVSGPGAIGVALACMLIAVALPPMEVIPFSANLGGAGLTAFGLALVAGDGRLALAGYLVVGAIIWILLSQL